MPDKPEILSKTLVAQSRLFSVERLHLRFANGVETEYERLRGSSVGAVLVVPLLDDDTLLLVREYGAGTERYELGFPKGRVEPGEILEQAANRELKEEVGHGAERIDRLHSLSIAPGYLGHTTHVLLARELYQQRLPGDEPEEIEVVPWRLSNLAQLLHQPDFSEARSIAALYLTRDFLQAEL